MTVAAPALTVECLSFGIQSARARASLEAFAGGVPSLAEVAQTTRYRGGSDWLVLWGPGHPARFEPMRRQVESGGHVLAVDLAYWQRDRKVRVSIDAAHPQAWVMKKAWPSSRFEHDAPPIGHVWNADGPVLIAGIGQKATVQYGPQVAEWELAMRAEAERRGRRVIYRPKPSNGSIDAALQGCALVVTWHSNVAVDAIRLGIPVICRDGAAAAVCASTWPSSGLPMPLPDSWRDRFLSNLAWFQWAPDEAGAMWTWLQELVA